MSARNAQSQKSTLSWDSSEPMSPSSLASSTVLPHSAEGKCCNVCGEKFGRVSNKPKRCAVCDQLVCDEHSLRRRELPNLPKPQRVCDDCDKTMILDEIRKEMEAEMTTLKEEIRNAEQENERRARENCEKATKLNNLEHEIAKAEKMHKQTEQSLVDRLQEEQQKGEKARLTIEKLQRDLDESHKSESLMSGRCKEVDQQMEALSAEAQTLRTRREDLTKHLQELEAKVASSVALSQLKSVSCGNCRARLDSMYKPRKGQGETEPDATVSQLSASTVRSKPALQSSKGCKAECLLM